VAALGREETLRRIDQTVDRLQSAASTA
jgi:hypothetical protein